MPAGKMLLLRRALQACHRHVPVPGGAGIATALAAATRAGRRYASARPDATRLGAVSQGAASSSATDGPSTSGRGSSLPRLGGSRSSAGNGHGTRYEGGPSARPVQQAPSRTQHKRDDEEEYQERRQPRRKEGSAWEEKASRSPARAQQGDDSSGEQRERRAPQREEGSRREAAAPEQRNQTRTQRRDEGEDYDGERRALRREGGSRWEAGQDTGGHPRLGEGHQMRGPSSRWEPVERTPPRAAPPAGRPTRDPRASRDDGRRERDRGKGRGSGKGSRGLAAEPAATRSAASAASAAPDDARAPTPKRAVAAAAAAAVAAAVLPRLAAAGDGAMPAAAATAVPDGSLVQLPDGVYPTYVPRNPGIRDGEWSERDELMVRAALKDAAQAPALAAAAAAAAASAVQAPIVLLCAEAEQLHELATRYGQPRYRAQQLADGVLQGARSVEDIETIPKEWRRQLAADGVVTGRSLLHHSVGDADGTRKFLLQLRDGRIVETVGIPTPGRLTVCVSSQVGCPMRCTFCATGKGGFARNLGAHEIVDQVMTVQEQYGRRVSNVVFMGMGEPLLNLGSVVRAYHALNKQLGIGGAFITISTVGVPNAIHKLARERLKATLAVSLHAPSQELRQAIIPSAKAYPLEALMQDCAAYSRATSSRVTFEYTLLAGVNDSDKQAVELVQLLRRHDMLSHVNVIPWNPVDESEFKRPSRNRVYAFQRAVEAAGVTCTVRETRGLEAAAACGQLRNRHQKEPLPGFAAPA